MKSIDFQYIHDTLQELSQFGAKGQITMNTNGQHYSETTGIR